jgi:Domain of unknown function (DUF4380)
MRLNRSLPALVSFTFSMIAAPLLAQEGIRELSYYGYGHAIELSNGTVKAVVAGESGGRILEFSLNGRNVLYLADSEKSWKPGEPPQSSAGRFDIGPELVIPRRDALWSGTWATEIAGDRHARLTSPPDEATGVQLIRDFVLAADSSHLACTQTIRNVSSRPVEWCHWSRTFVAGKGICVIPLTAPSRFPNSYVMYEEGSLINMRPEDPHIRVRDQHLEILAAPRKPKLGFDSYAGVMAYFAPSNLLFVKKFTTHPDRVYNEAAGLTISVWYPSGDMVELEPIGPRERLQPGDAAAFTEHWFLRDQPFPDHSPVDLTALHKTLIEMSVDFD